MSHGTRSSQGYESATPALTGGCHILWGTTTGTPSGSSVLDAPCRVVGEHTNLNHAGQYGLYGFACGFRARRNRGGKRAQMQRLPAGSPVAGRTDSQVVGHVGLLSAPVEAVVVVNLLQSQPGFGPASGAARSRPGLLPAAGSCA